MKILTISRGNSFYRRETGCSVLITKFGNLILLKRTMTVGKQSAMIAHGDHGLSSLFLYLNKTDVTGHWVNNALIVTTVAV